MKKIAVIGSDSFIAGKFLSAYTNKYLLKLFTRKPTSTINEILYSDLKDIKRKDFEGVDIVINFAAIVHQPKLKDKNLYKSVNTDLPIQIARRAKLAGVKHFIQMSTIAVYGKANNIDINSPEKPSNIYGESKLAADISLLAIHDENFKVSIVRPPMVYGGGEAPGNLQKLINFSQKGIPLPFKGVENRRDFIHVNNLVQALTFIIENRNSGIIIPTDRKSVSIGEIICYIEKHSDEKIRIFKIPSIFLRIIKMLKPNIYSKVFGNLRVACNLPDSMYEPKYSMEDGIKEMIEADK